MKLLICISLLVLLFDKFHCVPLIYQGDDDSSEWGFNVGGHLKLGVGAGVKDGLGYLRTNNHAGISIGGYNNGQRRADYPGYQRADGYYPPLRNPVYGVPFPYPLQQSPPGAPFYRPMYHPIPQPMY